MKICRVEEPDMSCVNVCAAYTYLETSFADDQERNSPPPCRDLAPALLSAPRLPCSLRRHSRRPPPIHGDFSSDITSSGKRLDLLSCLPPEIAVYILRFLHPRYLCRVVQVSRRWWWLAQYSSLRARRLRYLQRKREMYLQSKENVVPGQRHSSRTPRTVTRNSIANCGNSPLTSIQSSRRRRSRRDSPHGESGRDGETPVRLPRYHHRSLCRSERQRVGSPVFETPEDNSSDTCRTVEDDLSYMVRRCLFPNSPALSQQKKPCHLPTDTDDTPALDSDLSIKKSASKRRLKRL